MPTYSQCFICREWSWSVSRTSSGITRGVDLCLPCYVDVLEVRQARGPMGADEERKPRSTPSARERVHPTPESDGSPGSAPSPYVQGDLFGRHHDGPHRVEDPDKPDYHLDFGS